jgi:hypothetical protein
VQLDPRNKRPDLDDGGEMISYSPSGAYRCCQHNHGMGWPYYAENLWSATSDQGLAASLYAPGTVTAKVNGGADVTIAETTNYPFDGTVTLKVNPNRPATFPLYLRVPHWAEGATVKVNGQAVPAEGRPDSYLVLDRAWAGNDTVELTLPMHVAVRQWTQNKDSVSVDYGPLTFALPIGERWQQYATVAPGWPAESVYPTTPWNYGLALDATDPTKGLTVVRKAGDVPAQPFTVDAVPLAITAPARRIGNWQKDKFDMVGLLHESPVKADGPTETVTLVPMAAARLRISQFPVVSDAPDAKPWTMPMQASASHAYDGDTLDALSDGLVPANGSADRSIPRFTWWDHRGTREWVQYDFPTARRVGSVQVYWYDDQKTGGHCRPPAGWQVLYKDGSGQWRPVTNGSPAGVADDTFNRVTFDAVQARGLRLQVQLQDGASAGILEWRVGE